MVYQLHTSGATWLYKSESGKWDNLDSSSDTAKVAVGIAGLYQLHKEHTIWKYLGEGEGGGRKEIISSDSTVAEITVGGHVCARKESGEIIKYMAQSVQWVSLG
ncbi:hypothetical protein D9756_004449 [Leucocoprinus leucothites]|uniref:Uncharacterized protein n=1 Tax=Leucocoprinus leucothites TaxID=201217 RepID=A0A8H5LKP4_9AGAR|nr:hypothetical protein D9756_004449 [Leucoagaricus leucothites]